MRANMRPCLFLWLLPALWPVQVSASNSGQCRAVPAEIIAALESNFDSVGRMVAPHISIQTPPRLSDINLVFFDGTAINCWGGPPLGEAEQDDFRFFLLPVRDIIRNDPAEASKHLCRIFSGSDHSPHRYSFVALPEDDTMMTVQACAANLMQE